MNPLNRKARIFLYFTDPETNGNGTPAIGIDCETCRRERGIDTNIQEGMSLIHCYNGSEVKHVTVILNNRVWLVAEGECVGYQAKEFGM